MSNSPEFISAVNSSRTDTITNAALAITRRVSGHRGNGTVFTEIADMLGDVPSLEVRQVSTTSRTPAVQVIKSSEATLRINRNEETEEELMWRLLDTIPSLDEYLPIEFDRFQQVNTTKGETFFVIKPTSRDEALLVMERTLAFESIADSLMHRREYDVRNRAPDMTVIYAGRRATDMALRAAQNILRDVMPFTTEFRPAIVDMH